MNYEKEIQEVLRRLGINHSYLGYYYVSYAISLAMDDEKKLLLISKWLYTDVAKKHQTSIACVERNIRTVVNIIWKYGDHELLEEIANKPLLSKPKNGEFISMLSYYLKSSL